MGKANVRVQERFEVSLGGVQIASIVVGAVVSLAVVFFLGLEVGQRVGTRRAEAAQPASLVDLDAAAAPQPRANSKDITFPAELPRSKPTAPPPPRPPAQPAPDDEAGETIAAQPARPPPEEPAAAAPASPPADAAPAPAPAARCSWTVQLGASQQRDEAEALARKVQGLGPRVEEADVPGKGHYFRIRVGRFESRAQAEKYRADVIRETGISGNVIAPGN